MQTFLPVSDYAEAASYLDRQRLGKQRVEVMQILAALSGKSKGWVNHPAVKMWRGYTDSLVLYGFAICDEWINRGYKDTCRGKIADFASLELADVYDHEVPNPPWLGDEAFHESHQSNLLRKKSDHYDLFNWDVPNDLPYIWPINHSDLLLNGEVTE
jgi:hypothetical protein